jgi:competence CoiA-like predicted nuclease
MYKALDIRDNTEVVILDSKWLRAINQLREFDHQDILVCQGCKQPVRVRAGEQRREHFAHKHLENCDYADESAVLRNSLAVI